IDFVVDIVSIDGLPEAGSTSVTDSVRYRLTNNAWFHYSTKGKSGEYHRSANVFPYVLPEGDDGYHDGSAFKKEGYLDADDAVVDSGDTVTVDYRFTVAGDKGIDARLSTIVDHIDNDIFDLSDPDAIEVSGRYDHQPLGEDDFEL